MLEDNFVLHRSRRYVRRCATTATALLIGCAADAGQSSEPEGTLLGQEASGANTLRPPDGSYFADVIANGSGCPAGSWTTSISPDGQVFTTTFSKYEVQLDPTQFAGVLDCQVTVKLHSPGGLSYSVQSFYYSGYAYLEAGMVGQQTATYYFQGEAVTSRQARTDLVGPYDAPYLFSDVVETADKLIWSPCGAERDLQIRTRVSLRNATPRGTGYINLATIDGKNKLEFKLSWRKCDGTGGPDKGAPPTSATPDTGTAPVTPPAVPPAPATPTDTTPPVAPPTAPVEPTPPVTPPPATTPVEPTPPVTPPPATTPVEPTPPTTPPPEWPPVKPPETPVDVPPVAPPTATPPTTTPPTATPPTTTPPTRPPTTTPPRPAQPTQPTTPGTRQPTRPTTPSGPTVTRNPVGTVTRN